MNTILKEVSCFNPRVNSIRLLEARPSLSSPSCPSFTATKYDVFLSFRGADTRKTFISFLYKELEADGIRTFKDDNELVSGHLISSELLQAIKDSKIAVVVVSANYPASNWCLQELVEILKLQKKGLLRVLPIFYEVEPCHLRRHTEKIREQFMKHEKRHSAERVKSWRDALTYLASLSGECSKDWEDSQLVDKITEDVSKMLPSTTPGIEKKLIGIDKHMNELYPMLDLNSSQGVRVIGIWGRGSIGRSALAKHVYEDISHNFEAHCFLQYVSTVPLHCRKSHLRKELYSKMQGQGLSIDSSHWCYNAIKARLGNRKVLLVANDVDDLEQLGALEEELNCYGPGSRLIITTQDRQLLTSSCVKSVYEPELLKCYQVRPLRSVAFKHKLGPMNLLPGVSKESLGHDVKQAQCPSSPNVQLKSSLQDLPKPATFTKNVPVVESKKQKETTLLQNSFDALLSLKE